jgi:hypothetical protein
MGVAGGAPGFRDEDWVLPLVVLLRYPIHWRTCSTVLMNLMGSLHLQ